MLSFEDTENTSSLFSVAKRTKLDDEVKNETYDPYRSAWWEQVNQELNNEFENVSKECESLRQKIAVRNKRTKSSSRRSSGKKRSSSSSRRLNMNKCVFGDDTTLHDEKVWRANLRSPYKKELHFSSNSLRNDRISNVHVSHRGSVHVTLKNEENDLPPIPTVGFNDDDDDDDDDIDEDTFIPRPAGSTPAWISKLSSSARKKVQRRR